MKQRLTKWWLEASKNDFDYCRKQFEKPYRSTVAFCKWLESFGLLNKHRHDVITDIGAGMGQGVYYMAKRYPNSFFVGIDINHILVKKGNQYFKEAGQTNCKLVKGDLYAPSKRYVGKYNGIVSYQTLSWLPDYKLPIKKMAELKSDWIALTSLFYDGEVNCKIIVQDYTIPFAGKPYEESFYNVYSLKLIQELLKNCGYLKLDYTPFEIDIDLPKPETKGMGTYTEKLADGRRIQISGPLLMSWYFILARR